jgi:2-(1,2-epoxy-1,2-dihydrophenyl)acetyl-CoA isomerase
MSSILIHTENGVTYITLNRPEKYNSFNREMALALQSALKDCAANNDVRCIYLTGAGTGFCSGQDLGEVPDATQIDFEKFVSQHYNPIILAIRNLDKPVVAAVNGVAAGAGANVALACDIVLAAESACFIQAFSKIGLIPDSGGTFFLPRLIGLQRAAALMMTADKVIAADAVQMGMIYKCFADADFEKESKNIAMHLAQMPTKGIALTKKLLNQSFSNSLNNQLHYEMQLQVEAGNSYDFKEGVNAFMQKRKPEFKGK